MPKRAASISMAGRCPRPTDRIPTWLGTSRGHWEGAVLVAETIDMEPQAILNGAGLSHGGALKVRERWQVIRGREARSAARR